MRDVLIACTMLSMPAAAVLILGKTASAMFFGEGGGPEALSAEAEAGRLAFAARCAACHGVEAGGTDRGPSLLVADYAPDQRTDAHFRAAILRGQTAWRWDYGDMPAISGVDEPTLSSMVQYVREMQESAGIQG
ncbi:MAG: c-type cytochrome [Pseudomonadota bacterium]